MWSITHGSWRDILSKNVANRLIWGIYWSVCPTWLLIDPTDLLVFRLAWAQLRLPRINKASLFILGLRLYTSMYLKRIFITMITEWICDLQYGITPNDVCYICNVRHLYVYDSRIQYKLAVWMSRSVLIVIVLCLVLWYNELRSAVGGTERV